MSSRISQGVMMATFCAGLLLWGGGGVRVESVDAESTDGQQTDIIVGEIIVKFERTMTIAEGIRKLQEVLKENSLEKMSEITVINAVVLRTNIYELYKNGTIDKEEAQQRTLDLIQKIQEVSFVEDAELNEEVIERFPLFIEQV